jgi:LacI family transcriptional regulator
MPTSLCFSLDVYKCFQLDVYKSIWKNATFLRSDGLSRSESRQPQIDLGLPRRATLADVARLAGVSPTTASHVLTGNRPVALDTEERVRKAIAELRFRPNMMARSLRTRQSQTVALLVPDITNPYYPVVARGLQDALTEVGYHLFICNTDGAAERETEFIEDVIQRHVEAVVVEGFPLSGPAVRELVPANVPLVVLQTTPEPCDADAVVLDEEEGAFALGRYLVELGHTEFACIGGPTGVRTRGFKRAIAADGLRLGRGSSVRGDWTRAGGCAAMRKLLRRDPTPTAVFAANDLMAIGAMDALVAAGLRIPDDVSLVGFDDIEAAALIRPPLTTVHNPAYEAGQAAGRMLLERLLEPKQKPRQHLVSCALVERASATAPSSANKRRRQPSSQRRSTNQR